MAYYPATLFVPQFFNASSVLLSGGTLTAYLAGTSTLTNMYTNSAGTVAGSTITLNARGEPIVSGNTIVIHLDSAIAYKFVLKDASAATIWTIDNITDAGGLLRSDLASTSDVAIGDALVGVKQPLTGAVARTQHAKNQEIITPEDFGAVGDGVTDDTTALKSWLASGKKYLVAGSGKTYLTTDTLFVTTDDTIVDFCGSKIKNLSNSMYAICLVTASISALTEAALSTVLTELHYGDEIENSHIKNLVVSMSATSSGGNNLGAGIVYGKGCTLSNIVVQQTNGNGIEVRNSTDCHVDRVRLTPRTYGAFFFMTKDCTLSFAHISGCARGIITKMSQGGDPVNFRAYRCVVRDLSSGLYYTVGGEYKETVLTDAIYEADHEKVSDVVYDNCTFLGSSDQVKVELSYWASRFTYDNCTFISLTTAAGANIGTSGNQTGGDVQGRNHRFVNCSFQNASTVGNAAFTVGADTLISGCVFNGSYQRMVLVDDTYPTLVTFDNNTVRGSLLTMGSTALAMLSNDTNSKIIARNNVMDLTLASSGSGTDSAIALNPDIFSGNKIAVTGASTYTHTTVYVDSGIAHDNDLYYSDLGGNVYGINASDAANIQNNTIGNNGTVGAASRAIYLQSASVEVVRNEGNHVTGTWEYTQFANLSQNIQYSKRLKTGSAAPADGTWAVGDRVVNDAPAVGQPKAWACTVAGTPGTWVSEGNL